MDTMCCHGFPHCSCNGNTCGNGCPIAFGSSTASTVPLPPIITDPIDVVSATVDTRGMRDATSLLTFTSTISAPVGIPVRLLFQIKRTNRHGATIKVGPTYTFATLATALESESFVFQFADPNLRPGSHTYSVEVSTNLTTGLTANNENTTGGATINEAVLGVLSIAV